MAAYDPIDAIKALKMIRDEEPITYGQLHQKLGPGKISSRAVGMKGYGTHSAIMDLRRAGLVSFQGDLTDDSVLRIEEAWWNIQSILDISLSELTMLAKGSLVVEPYFHDPDEDIKSDVFVVMPFKENLRPIFSDHITKVVLGLGLTVTRGDDIFDSGQIMNGVWSSIFNSKLIIADCTGKNPNVFYEIGIAHTIGKHVILITQKPSDVPVDLRHIRYIVYKRTELGLKQLETSLERTIKLTLDIK